MSADRTFCNANEQTRRRWLKTPSQQLLRHRDKGLVWFLCAPNVRWSRRGRPDPLSVLVLSHLSSKHVCAFVWFAGSGRRARRELYKHPSPTCFLFPTHVFFPPLLLPLRSPTNNTRMSKSHRTQERQHTYLSLSTQKERGVGGQRLFFSFFLFSKLGPPPLYVWYCLSVFSSKKEKPVRPIALWCLRFMVRGQHIVSRVFLSSPLP